MSGYNERPYISTDFCIRVDSSYGYTVTLSGKSEIWLVLVILSKT